jgi:hypothetical protein
MQVVVYSVVAYRLFPFSIFLFYLRILKFNKVCLLIAAIVISSFLGDFIGLSLANSRLPTAPVSNIYQIIERTICTFILTSVYPISQKSKLFLRGISLFISILQFVYCFKSHFQLQNDYIKLLSGLFICFLALHTLFFLIYKSPYNSPKININAWPIIAIFFYTTSMLVPQMITNIDDSIEFPECFHKIRLGVTLGSNFIRDSLFAFFFFQAKQMDYDTGK